MPIANRVCFQINLRDGLRCRQCGRGPGERETYHSGFGYHHVTPLSQGGADAIENLLLLCRTCHDAHHDGRRPLNFGPQAQTGDFACAHCDARIDSQTVEMNCGWYRCHTCGERVHLFDHFGFGSSQSHDAR